VCWWVVAAAFIGSPSFTIATRINGSPQTRTEREEQSA
jgi:hypothetical protein